MAACSIDYSRGVKRLLLVVVVAACVSKQTPIERHIRDQLGRNTKIELDTSSKDGSYEAHRKERMDFELDAKGTLKRTEVEIPRAALPKAVIAAVPIHHVFGVKVVFEKGTVTFWLDGEDQHWIVDANGKILDYDFEGDDCDDC